MGDGAVAAPAAPPQYSADGRWWWNGTQWVPVERAHQPGACLACGAMPAKQVQFFQHTGMVVLWQNRRTRGTFCRSCAIAVFRRQMNLTLALGWWGILSGFILNPLTIVYDLVQRYRIARWPEPIAADVSGRQLDKGRPVFLRPGFAVVLALAVVAGALVVVPR